jgi:hypothetical protein
MNLLKIAAKVGSTLLRSAVPASGLFLDAVNTMLPDSVKLDADASGDDLKKVIEGLSPEDRARVLEKEYDVEIVEIQESHSTVRAMLDSDSKSPHTTRPKIAYQSFQITAAIHIMVAFGWMYAISVQNEELVSQIVQGYPFVLALTAPFVILLHAYFGILKTEANDRLNAANKLPTGTGSGLLTNLANKIFNKKEK